MGTEYTLVYETEALCSWSGYVQQLPQMGKVRGTSFEQVRKILSYQLAQIILPLPNKQDVRIRSEFYYRVAPNTSLKSLN